MNHFILKLTNGELVYGVVDPDNTDKKMVTLENPLTWEEYETSEGGTGSALVKFCVGTKETKLPIAATSITSMALMSDRFAHFYDAAVAVNVITDEAYDEKLAYMTKQMIGLVMDYQAKAESEDNSGALVSYSTDSSNTIH